MAKQKRIRKGSVAQRKKSSARRKPAAGVKSRPSGKTVRKTAARRATVGKKATSRKPPARKAPTGKAPTRKAIRRKATGRATAPRPSVRRFPPGVGSRSDRTTRGLGAEAGGQSGDTEGLSRTELADSESVEELVEEGQAFEAGIVSGVENAPDADKGGVRTRQVPEDDVPQEYLDED